MNNCCNQKQKEIERLTQKLSKYVKLIDGIINDITDVRNRIFVDDEKAKNESFYVKCHID